MPAFDVFPLICRILDFLNYRAVPWALRFAGSLYASIRSLPQKLDFSRFRFFRRGKYARRRQVPRFLAQVWSWLPDFLVVGGGSLVLALLCVAFFT